jgi:hypothetical protein
VRQSEHGNSEKATKATEPNYRDQLRRPITEASGILFEDITMVGELEQFLLAAWRI